MDWELRKSRRWEWREYRLFLDGEEVAFAKWRPHGESAELHNTVAGARKALLKKAREIFRTVLKPEMAVAGVKFIVVADVKTKAKGLMRHYWRFMGFDFTCDQHGCTCAVMEV